MIVGEYSQTMHKSALFEIHTNLNKSLFYLTTIQKGCDVAPPHSDEKPFFVLDQ